MHGNELYGEKYLFISFEGENLASWAVEYQYSKCSLEVQKNMSHSLIGLTRAAVEDGNEMTAVGLVSEATAM